MLNSVILMGRLTEDPELKTTTNNVSVVSFTIAVERSYAKQGFERQTDFINVVAWRNTAEFISRYFRKGQLMAIQGSLQVRDYTDKEGNKRRVYEVVADNVHFADSKKDNNSYGGNSYSDNNGSYNSAPPAQQNAPVSFSNADAGDFEEIITDDDDLPF